MTNRQCLCVVLVAAWVEGARKKQRIIGWRGRRNPEKRRKWGRRLETDDAPDKERPRRSPGGRFDYGEEEMEGFVCEGA